MLNNNYPKRFLVYMADYNTMQNKLKETEMTVLNMNHPEL
jgi:hypothetical protein